MQTRSLGELNVSAVGLGCMGVSHAYGGQPEAESIATLRRAVELGVTLFDTAEVYGPYENEILLGKALKGVRDSVVSIASTGDIAPADFRKTLPRFQPEALAANARLLTAIENIAKAHGRTRAQIALAWALHKGRHVVPIPGTRRISRLEENVQATDIALSLAEMEALDVAMPPDQIVGDRYGQAGAWASNVARK